MWNNAYRPSLLSATPVSDATSKSQTPSSSFSWDRLKKKSSTVTPASSDNSSFTPSRLNRVMGYDTPELSQTSSTLSSSSSWKLPFFRSTMNRTTPSTSSTTPSTTQSGFGRLKGFTPFSTTTPQTTSSSTSTPALPKQQQPPVRGLWDSPTPSTKQTSAESYRLAEPTPLTDQVRSELRKLGFDATPTTSSLPSYKSAFQQTPSTDFSDLF